MAYLDDAALGRALWGTVTRWRRPAGGRLEEREAENMAVRRRVADLGVVFEGLGETCLERELVCTKGPSSWNRSVGGVDLSIGRPRGVCPCDVTLSPRSVQAQPPIGPGGALSVSPPASSAHSIRFPLDLLPSDLPDCPFQLPMPTPERSPRDPGSTLEGTSPC